MILNTIFEQVKSERDTFRSQEVEIIPGWKYNQWDTLRRIELYYNSQFETGPTDNEGYDKYFKNTTRPVVLTAEKAIDLDTKDIRPIPDDDTSDMATWFLSKETRQYLRDTKFGAFLNKMGNAFPKFGSIVSKKVNGKHMDLNLHTLINEQRAETLFDSPFVTEEHEYNIADIVRLSTDMPSWENMDILLDRLQSDPQVGATLKVYERRGIGPRWWFDKGSSSQEIVRGFCIVADIDRVVEYMDKDAKGKDMRSQMNGGLYLFRAVTDEFPYQERHWDKIAGRWLGIGEAEIVFDPQVRLNELAHLKQRALWWKSKQIFWTADDIIARNIFSDVRDGEVLQSKNGINAVQWNQSDLAAFKEEQDDWADNIQRNTFAFDSQIGENLPSGTPFSLGALLAGKSGEFFAKKREEFGLFIRDIMMDSVIPEMMKEKKNLHKFNFTDEDVEDRKHLVDLAVMTVAQKKIQEKYLNEGIIPSEAEVDREIETARGRLASRKGLYAQFRKDFYEGIKYHFDYVVTNEQLDLGQNLTTLSNLLVNISKNPQVLDDPRIGKLLSVIMKKAGVNPTDLGFDKKLTATVEQQNTGQQIAGLVPGAPPEGAAPVTPNA